MGNNVTGGAELAWAKSLIELMNVLFGNVR